MIIKNIKIDSFGKLKNFNIDLTDGLNVVSGDNEAGKSTVCNFIQYILYGFLQKSSTRDNPLPDGIKHIPWEDERVGGSLLIEYESTDILIERSNIKGGKNKFAIVTNAVTGEIIPEFTLKQPGEVMLNVSPQTFERTTFIKQNEHIIGSNPEIELHLRNLATSGEETVSFEKAIGKIDAAIKKIHNLKNRGQLYDLSEEEVMLRNELLSADETYDKWISLTEQLENKEIHVNSLKIKDADLRNKLVVKKQAVINERTQEIAACKQHIEKFNENISRLNNSITKNNVTLNITFVSRLRKLESDLRIEKEKLSNTKQELNSIKDNIKAEESKTPVKNRTTLLFISMSIICLICAVAFGILNIPSAYITFGAAALLFAVLKFVIGSQKSNAKEIDTNVISALYKKSEMRYNEYQNNIVNIKREIEVLYSDINPTFLDSTDTDTVCDKIDKVLTELSSLHSSLAQETAKLSGLSQGMPKKLLDCPAENRANVAHDNSLSEADMENSLEKLLSEIRQEEIDIHKIKIETDNIWNGKRTTDLILSRLKQIEEEKERLTHRKDALSLAKTSLERAYNQLQSMYAPNITRTSEKYFNAFTKGNNRTLFFGKDSGVSIYEEGHVRPLGFFSAGTRDAAYLAVRIAVTELIFIKEKPTFVFDDCFTCFDSSRLRGALSILTELSKKYQVIFFTCKNEERSLLEEYANNIII